MSRKVIEIEFSKCPYFKRPILELMDRMDFEGKIVPTSDGVYGLKGNMSNFINTLISEDIEAGIEIFGKSYTSSWIPDVQKQVDYLTDLINLD